MQREVSKAGACVQRGARLPSRAIVLFRHDRNGQQTICKLNAYVPQYSTVAAPFADMLRCL